MRIALTGSSKPAIMTIVSTRCTASRVLLACIVVIEPSWPVFMAWSMSSVSGPRHSPTTIRSGRIRRLLISSSRMLMRPLPSMLGGRDSSRTTCGWRSCSSAASSIVTIRSSVGMKDERLFSKRRLTRARAADDQDVQAGLDARLEELDHLRRARLEADVIVPGDAGRRPNRRIDMLGPSIASGGMTALTREPSARRASTIGLTLIAPATDRADDLVDDVHEVRVVAELDIGHLQPALALDVNLPGPVDQNIADIRVGQEDFERSQAERLVEDLADEPLAFGEIQDGLFLVTQFDDQFLDLFARLLVILFADSRQVEFVDEFAVNAVFKFVELIQAFAVDAFLAGLAGALGGSDGGPSRGLVAGWRGGARAPGRGIICLPSPRRMGVALPGSMPVPLNRPNTHGLLSATTRLQDVRHPEGTKGSPARQTPGFVSACETPQFAAISHTDNLRTFCRL